VRNAEKHFATKIGVGETADFEDFAKADALRPRAMCGYIRANRQASCRYMIDRSIRMADSSKPKKRLCIVPRRLSRKALEPFVKEGVRQ
jgi:hypothetical protein